MRDTVFTFRACLHHLRLLVRLRAQRVGRNCQDQGCEGERNDGTPTLCGQIAIGQSDAPLGWIFGDGGPASEKP